MDMQTSLVAVDCKLLQYQGVLFHIHGQAVKAHSVPAGKCYLCILLLDGEVPDPSVHGYGGGRIVVQRGLAFLSAYAGHPTWAMLPQADEPGLEALQRWGFREVRRLANMRREIKQG